MPLVPTTGEQRVSVIVGGLPEWDYIAAPEALTYKVRVALDRFCLLNRGEGIVVGVSGGPDSLSLLHVLWRLREERDLSLCVAHLNHGLRGEEADADEAFVKSFCDRMGIPCVTEKVDVKALSHAEKLSVAQAGRRARYRLFAKVMGQFGAKRVALGHTATDVIETLLLNLFRGTGTEGLQGIPPQSPLIVDGQEKGVIIRPLILCWREETQAYARVYRLNPRYDPTNEDPQIPRNWVRLVLLPMLRGRFSKVDGALWRLSQLARDESALLNALADEHLAKLAIVMEERKIGMRRDEFLALPKGLRRRLLRRCVEKLVGALHEVSFEHFEETLGLIDRHYTGASLHLPSGLFFHVERGIIWLIKRG